MRAASQLIYYDMICLCWVHITGGSFSMHILIQKCLCFEKTSEHHSRFGPKTLWSNNIAWWRGQILTQHAHKWQEGGELTLPSSRAIWIDHNCHCQCVRLASANQFKLLVSHGLESFQKSRMAQDHEKFTYPSTVTNWDRIWSLQKLASQFQSRLIGQ